VHGCVEISSVLELFGTFSFKRKSTERKVITKETGNGKMTKILILTHRFSPEVGGIETNSGILATAFTGTYHGPTAEKATLQKLNQGERKKRAAYRFFLDFLVLLCQDKRTETILLFKRRKKSQLSKSL
jgi:ATPase subunit of ABC transporter with duplicated ATPase domains